MAFAAYLVISADLTSIAINLSLIKVKGAYKFLIKLIASSLSAPTTTLSGCIKSLIAAPSFKNSGLETTAKVK